MGKVLSIIVCLVVVFSLIKCQPDPKVALSNEAILKIEEFRKTYQRLPESLEEVGIKVERRDRVYYVKASDNKYILWYRASKRHIRKYDSHKKIWSFGI